MARAEPASWVYRQGPGLGGRVQWGRGPASLRQGTVGGRQAYRQSHPWPWCWDGRSREPKPGWLVRRRPAGASEGEESTPGRVRACAKALRLETDTGRVRMQPGPVLFWVLRSPQDGNRGCPARGADMPIGGRKMHRIHLGMKEGVGSFLRPLSHIATHGVA